MIRLAALLSVFTGLLLVWHESGEDLAVFCYRMGSGFINTARSRALVPVPVSQDLARTNRDCSNLSRIYSTISMMSKD